MTTSGDKTTGQAGDTTTTTTTTTTSFEETGQTEDNISMEIMTPEKEKNGKDKQTAPATVTQKSDTSAKLSLMQTRWIKAIGGWLVDVYITMDTRQGLKQINFVEEDRQFTLVGFITLTDKYLTDLTALWHYMDKILEVDPRAFERWGITVDQPEDDENDQPASL